jgi:two-component system response regulator NreC
MGRKIMKRVKVLLVSDHLLVRESIRARLEVEPDIEVVADTNSGRAAINKVQELFPDVAVLDITMPFGDGLLMADQLCGRLRCPTKVIILAAPTNESNLLYALQAGVLGYVSKTATFAELASAIRTISRGEMFISPSTSTKCTEMHARKGKTQEGDRFNVLTKRERQVFQWLAVGHPNREIAEMLNISVKTVETHRANVMRKLGVQNLAELVKYAICKGVISPDL